MLENPIVNLMPDLDEADDELTDEEREERAKAERIRYHRENVRNGPVKLRSITSGMLRRAKVRDITRRTRKTRRKQVANYFETQRIASSVRAHLQFAGIVPFVAGREIDPIEQVVSVSWLITRFGPEEVGEEVSFAYDDVLKALDAALRFQNQALGLDDKLPADYVLPVYEQGTHPDER